MRVKSRNNTVLRQVTKKIFKKYRNVPKIRRTPPLLRKKQTFIRSILPENAQNVQQGQYGT